MSKLIAYKDVESTKIKSYKNSEITLMIFYLVKYNIFHFLHRVFTIYLSKKKKLIKLVTMKLK